MGSVDDPPYFNRPSAHSKLSIQINQGHYFGKEGKVAVSMITTNETHEVKPFSFMPLSGFKTWRTAGLDVWRPYYLMSFACKEGRTWISQAMLLWCEQDLIGFCEQAGSSAIIKIHQITKLVPPQSGHIAMWDSIAIREIWHCADRNVDVDLMLIADDANQQTKLNVIDHSISKEMEKLFDARVRSNVPSL